jgi:hypothetical protein
VTFRIHASLQVNSVIFARTCKTRQISWVVIIRRHRH